MRQSSEPYTGSLVVVPHLFPDVADYLLAYPIRLVGSLACYP